MAGFNHDPQALILEELLSAGVAPTGPVSAWPQSRNEELQKLFLERAYSDSRPGDVVHDKEIGPSFGQMATGLMKTAGQALRHGRVAEEVRNERYETCKNCPFFIEDSKRCSQCGCFMEAKTWIGGDPDMLCPQKKWSR